MATAAATLFKGWPDQYTGRFRAIYAEHRDEVHQGSNLKDVFSHFYAYLYTRIAEPQFDFLREPFEKFVSDEWEGVIRGQYRWLSERVQKDHRWISTSQAKELMPDISVRGFRKLAKEGEIGAVVIPLGDSSENQIWIDRSDFENWKAEAEGWITRPEAMKRLGITLDILMTLAYGGAIRSQKGLASSGNSAAWTFSKEDVDRILNALESTMLPVNRDIPSARQQTLVKFFRRRNGISAAVLAISEKRMLPACRIGDGQGLGDYLFRTEDLRRAHLPNDADNDKELMNLREAANFLDVSPRVVSFLISGGILGPSIKPTVGKERLLYVKDVEVFHARFILNKEAASLLKINPVWVGHHLSSYGVEGRVIWLSKKGRTTIYERDRVIAAVRERIQAKKATYMT